VLVDGTTLVVLVKGSLVSGVLGEAASSRITITVMPPASSMTERNPTTKAPLLVFFAAFSGGSIGGGGGVGVGPRAISGCAAGETGATVVEGATVEGGASG